MKIVLPAFRFAGAVLRNNVRITCRSAHTAVKEHVNTSLLTALNQDIHSGGVVPVFRRALLYPSRVALQDELGIYTYAGLHQAASDLSEEIAKELLGETGVTVAYLCGNDASHVIVQWAIWMSGNIAVPLTALHPPPMLKYYIEDSYASLVVCSQEHEELLSPITDELKRPLITTNRAKEISFQLFQPESKIRKTKTEGNEATATLIDVGKTNKWYSDAEAMLIYTSGTTSKPKGVVWTHKAWSTQIAALHSAWNYTCTDVVLHTLPLHHVHGQLNSLNASLAAGARIRMLPSFTSHTVWARLLGMGESSENQVTMFHGVPAMYARLLADYEKMFNTARTKEYVRATLASRMRLACAGSAPLPPSLFNRWEEISGQRLLERYGMSEVGMALSNPYRPAEGRERGAVGLPLPGVSVRIADESNLQPLVTLHSEEPNMLISLGKLGLPNIKDDQNTKSDYEWKQPTIEIHKKSENDTYTGELLLKGPAVFTKYWNRDPIAVLEKDFTTDEWFRTGDTVSFGNNKFKILGRTSVDIIKTGGYKVSALQVESILLEHPKIADVAVIGVADEKWGEKVSALVVLKPKTKITLEELKDWAKDHLAPYQLPNALMLKDVMPRNHMGKLDKKLIASLFVDGVKK